MNKIIISIILILIVFPVYSQCPGECGDAMGDGDIDITDANAIAQYYTFFDPQPFCPENADCDIDDEITILDALLVAQYYVGLIPKLPCQPPVKYEQQAGVNIAWDHNEETVYGYNVYKAVYDENEEPIWLLHAQSGDTTEYIYLDPGLYIFGVQGYWHEPESGTTSLHTSLDENAEPPQGWYVKITE